MNFQGMKDRHNMEKQYIQKEISRKYAAMLTLNTWSQINWQIADQLAHQIKFPLHESIYERIFHELSANEK